jgi:hypothetical protein
MHRSSRMSGSRQTSIFTLSTDAELNLYLFHGELSIGAEGIGLSARMYKNNYAQVLRQSVESDYRCIFSQ